MPDPRNGLQDPKNPVTPPASDPSQITPKPGGVTPGTPVGGQPAPAPEPQGGMVPHGALHEERERRKESDARWEQVKALYGDKIRLDANGNILPPSEGPAPVNPNVNVHAPSDVAQRIDKMWEDDPKQAVRAEISMALNWFDQQAAAVDYQRDTARSKHTDYSKWESEINSYLRTLPLLQRNQPGIIETAYKYVKGDKIDSILEAERAELARKYAAGELVQGLGPGTASGTGVPAGPALTEDELKVANAMHMTPEEYMKHKTPARGQ